MWACFHSYRKKPSGANADKEAYRLCEIWEAQKNVQPTHPPLPACSSSGNYKELMPVWHTWQSERDDQEMH